MAKKVTIELTERQARILLTAVEEWFRLRMGQDRDLANDLAFMDYERDDAHPERFDAAIQRRDAMSEVIKAMFRIAWPHYGVPQKKHPEVQIAGDIWSQLRWELGPKNEWQSTPIQLGPEPLPKITVEEEKK